MSEIPEDIQEELERREFERNHVDPHIKRQTQSERVYEHLKTLKDPKQLKGKTVIEIADKLKVSKALVYKMKRKLIDEGFWEKPEARPRAMQAREPVIRVSAEPKIEIVEEPEPEIPEDILKETPSEEIRPEPTEPTAEITAESPIIEKLTPILERSVSRLFDTGIEIFSGSKGMLSTQEGKDTATLLPIMIYRFTKVALNEDQFIDMTCITHFGSIILKVVNEKVQEWRKSKKEKKEAPKETPEPTPEPPKEEPSQSEKKSSEGKQLLRRLEKNL